MADKKISELPLRDTVLPTDQFANSADNVTWRSPVSALIAAIPTPEPEAESVKVFAFAGQSNSLGNGPGGDTALNPNVFAWDWNANSWLVAALGNRPFNLSGQNNSALQAARRYQEKHGGKVYLIGYAVGGTAIATWQAGGVNYDTPAVPTDPCLKDICDAAFASATLTAAGKSKVDAFLWNQGEADETLTYAAYLTALDTLINTYRGASWGGGERTPFIAAEMLPYTSSGKHIVSYRMKAARGDDPYFALISNYGLDPLGIGDSTHVTGADLTRQGARYAAAIDDMPLRYAPLFNSWRKPWFRANLHNAVTNVTGDGSAYELICQNEGPADTDDPYGMHSGGVSGTGRATIPKGTWGRWLLRAKITLTVPTGLTRCEISFFTSSGVSRYWFGPFSAGDDNGWLTLPILTDVMRLTNDNNVFVTVDCLTPTSVKDVSILGGSSNAPTWWSMEKLDD